MMKMKNKGGILVTGTIAVIMIFSIPLIAIITDHFQKQTKVKQALLKDQIELEKLKHENFLLETDKMKIELEKMKLENNHKNDQFL